MHFVPIDLADSSKGTKPVLSWVDCEHEKVTECRLEFFSAFSYPKERTKPKAMPSRNTQLFQALTHNIV